MDTRWSYVGARGATEFFILIGHEKGPFQMNENGTRIQVCLFHMQGYPSAEEEDDDEQLIWAGHSGNRAATMLSDIPVAPQEPQVVLFQ